MTYSLSLLQVICVFFSLTWWSFYIHQWRRIICNPYDREIYHHRDLKWWGFWIERYLFIYYLWLVGYKVCLKSYCRNFSMKFLPDMTTSLNINLIIFSVAQTRISKNCSHWISNNSLYLLSFVRNVVSKSNQIDSLKNVQDDPIFCIS